MHAFVAWVIYVLVRIASCILHVYNVVRNHVVNAVCSESFVRKLMVTDGGNVSTVYSIDSMMLFIMYLTGMHAPDTDDVVVPTGCTAVLRVHKRDGNAFWIAQRSSGTLSARECVAHFDAKGWRDPRIVVVNGVNVTETFDNIAMLDVLEVRQVVDVLRATGCDIVDTDDQTVWIMDVLTGREQTFRAGDVVM